MQQYQTSYDAGFYQRNSRAPNRILSKKQAALQSPEMCFFGMAKQQSDTPTEKGSSTLFISIEGGINVAPQLRRDIIGLVAIPTFRKRPNNALLVPIRSLNSNFTRDFSWQYLSWPAGMPQLKPITVQPMAMWRIHIDVFGPLDMSRNGNRYVALGVCALLKYVEAKRNYFIF